MISPSLSRAGVQDRERERGMTLSLTGYWHRIVLFAIVALSAVLNFVGLSKEGYDNQYYAAAVKSMSLSWHNFFFNSFDPGGFVTIDKPPLGFWFQVASVKVFGFNGVALLIPQALAGVLAVALLYHLVARTFGRTAGLISAVALAITPISVVTARNNTIDSSLVLVVLLGAWAVLKAAETGKLRWLVLCAVLVGLGFNIKMLEAYLVLPAFGLVYLLGTKKRVWRRLVNLALAGVILLAVSLSWAAAVDFTSAANRPWVDSTTTNSEISLAIGYNGLQRLTGNHSISTTTSATTTGANAGGPGGNGGPGGVSENGPTGVLRLLDTQLGSQIGWLLPLAIVGFILAFWQTRPRFQTLDDRQRSLLLWGVWLLTTGAFFSVALFYHTYYLVMLAPAVCALAGISIVALWQAYSRAGSRIWWLLPLVVLGAAGVQVHILASYPSWSRWLTPLLLTGCAIAAICLVFFHIRPFSNLRAAIVAAGVAVLALLAPSAAFAQYTMQNTQTGAILRAGPTASGVTGGFGGGGGQGGPPNGANGPGGGFGTPPGGAAIGQGGTPSAPPTGAGATGRANANGAFGPANSTGTRNNRGFDRAAGRSRFGGGGPGGSSVSATLVTYLEKHRGTAKYLAATTNSNSAAPLIIATGQPIMSLGGFSGSDPILTTAQFASLVKAGEVRYFLINGGGPGGPGAGSGITSWIQAHSKLITVGGTQLYEYTG
ncbi:MAG TPA: glycosyltransferase family 39 protein [Chloroflexota bacterium]